MGRLGLGELEAEVARECDDGAGGARDLGAERGRQREPQCSVSRGMKPLPGVLDRICVIAEVCDLGHVAEYDAVPGQRGLDGAQRVRQREGLRIESAVYTCANFLKTADDGAPAGAGQRILRGIRQREIDGAQRVVGVGPDAYVGRIVVGQLRRIDVDADEQTAERQLGGEV
jgi:hypothetical protein